MTTGNVDEAVKRYLVRKHFWLDFHLQRWFFNHNDNNSHDPMLNPLYHTLLYYKQQIYISYSLPRGSSFIDTNEHIQLWFPKYLTSFCCINAIIDQ